MSDTLGTAYKGFHCRCRFNVFPITSDNRPIVHGLISSQAEFEVTPEGGSIASSAPVGSGSMLLDTGATATVLDLEIAEKLSLPETELYKEETVSGIGGSVSVRQFTGVTYLSTWGITVPTTFLAFPILVQTGFTAIIGMDILSDFVLIVDGPGKRIDLR